jgi:hypothetical protein
MEKIEAGAVLLAEAEDGKPKLVFRPPSGRKRAAA